MLEQGQQRQRREILRRRLGQHGQQRARRARRQRPPGGIVDLDPPARAMRRDSLGQRAIGRDQRRGPPRRLQRLAQRQRDRLRLVGGGRQLDRANARQPPPSASSVVHLPVKSAGASALAIARPRASEASWSDRRRAIAAPRRAPRPSGRAAASAGIADASRSTACASRCRDRACAGRARPIPRSGISSARSWKHHHALRQFATRAAAAARRRARDR